MALVPTPQWIKCVYRRFMSLVFNAWRYFRWLVFYLSKKASSKIAEFRKKYQISRAQSIKDKGDNAFEQRRFDDAAAAYEQVLDYLRTSYPNSPKVQKLKNGSLFAKAAIHVKLLKWDECTADCRDILRRGAKLQLLFQMMHDKLDVSETTRLLQLLDETGCAQFQNCSFDVTAVQSYCYQKGKCCAAASIAGGLNTIFGIRHFTTNQALQRYIELYPKYRVSLKKRSTKQIGNFNLRRGMQTLCQEKLNVRVELEILISGPRAKRRGFYVVQRDDLTVDTEQDLDLDKYAHLLKAYLQCEKHVLLAHVRNHYCLVFAIRLNPDGSYHILISKRGQTPKDWVSLKSFLMIFARSKIYKLFAAKQRDDLI